MSLAAAAVWRCFQGQQATWALLQLEHHLPAVASLISTSSILQDRAYGSPARSFSSSTASSSSTTSSSSSSSSTSTTSSASEGTSSTSSKQSSRPSIREIKAVRAQIFEQHQGDGRRSGRQAILRPLKGRYIADWYFTVTGPKMPMMDDELEEDRILKTQLARATGSGPPKKGQGKRAKK